LKTTFVVQLAGFATPVNKSLIFFLQETFEPDTTQWSVQSTCRQSWQPCKKLQRYNSCYCCRAISSFWLMKQQFTA